jgi:hypothetical protein
LDDVAVRGETRFRTWSGPRQRFADSYLIDVKFGIIMDVEASRAIRQAEVGASQTMLVRTQECFGIRPQWLVGDTA